MRHTKIFLAVSLGIAVAVACGGDDGESSGSSKKKDDDAGSDSSFGGSGGVGGGDPNCTSPNCSGCQGCFLICMCQQNNADACLAQCSGAGGTGGMAGTGGVAGTGGMGGSTGGTTGGSCNPSFCPNPGFGSPCCVTPNGPCGADMGMGCMPTSGGDI